MGRIAAVLVELMPKLSELRSLAEQVGTTKLQHELEKDVMWCFEALKPLSHRFAVVKRIPPACSYCSPTEVCVRTWVRLKKPWHKHGSIVDWPGEFFEVIREHGQDMVPHVRQPIKETFEEMVALARELMPYKSITVTRTVNKYVDAPHLDPPEPRRIFVKTIKLETPLPKRVMLIGSCNGGRFENTIHLLSWGYVCEHEDLIDDLLALYRSALARVSEVREHNERIMERMRELAAPWAVEKALFR